MSCTRPKYAIQRLKDGKPQEGMAIPSFFNFRESLIITSQYHGNLDEYLLSHVPPSWVKDVDYRGLYLPCGKCAACRLKYGKEWSHRGLMEAFCHEENCFLTLTLDDEHLNEHGDYVRVDYLQKFFKRFRSMLYRKKKVEYIKTRKRLDFHYHFCKGDVERPKIRYLACGEYGSINFRPHYHCIVFGYYPHDAEYEKTNALGDEIFISRELNSLWEFGHIFIGDVSAESIAYVAGYVTKKQELIDSLPEEFQHAHLPFIVMSRKPGLGYDFFAKFTDDFIHDAVKINNKSIQVPRYFMKQFEKYRPDVADRLKLNRRKASENAFNNTLEANRLWHLDELFNLRLSKKVRQQL